MSAKLNPWAIAVSAWLWFDGKKTIVGTACLVLAAYLQGLLEIVQATNDPFQLIIVVLAYNGTFLTTGGGVHKYVKNTAKPPSA